MNPILSLKDAKLAFERKPLFENLDLHIYERDRICLVGRNGEGKSSIIKLITGDYELTDGTRFVMPGIKIGYLEQDSHLTHCTLEQQQTVLDYVLSALQKVNEEERYKAESVIAPLLLNPNSKLSELSGGQKRRASLAKALVESPDLLLLDEPTNHLDISSIIWLENFLQRYHGAVLCISHDRRFLMNVTSKTFWLDRGELRVLKRGYKDFEDWSVNIMEQEQKELENLERKMQIENVWLAQGVTARRKRNQRRLSELFAMRNKLKAERSRFKTLHAQIEIDDLQKRQSSKLVAEFKHISKKYGDNIIFQDWNYDIIKGEKLGVIGPNGSGKSTFLKLLTGVIEPDSGQVKKGKNITISYLDQMRHELDPEKTIQEILCPDGGDHIMYRNKLIHVAGYIKKFMFDPKLIRAKAGILSGGQANRLLLAKVLANPGNVIILDEPTNDLDTDTLDMLQELLTDYQGTLILVSHDRDFIDRTVTKTLVFEGDAKLVEIIGGYADYEEYKAKKDGKPSKNKSSAKSDESLDSDEEKDLTPVINKGKKLSYKYQRELDSLPIKIEQLTIQKKALEEKMFQGAGAESTNNEELDYVELSNSYQEVLHLINEYETRWLELEEMKNE